MQDTFAANVFIGCCADTVSVGFMFGKKGIYSLANPTQQKRKPSSFRDGLTLFGVCFAYGVLGWYLIRPILGF